MATHEEKKELLQLKVRIRKLSNEQRIELFDDYCTHCGEYDGDRVMGCQCWNDE